MASAGDWHELLVEQLSLGLPDIEFAVQHADILYQLAANPVVENGGGQFLEILPLVKLMVR